MKKVGDTYTKVATEEMKWLRVLVILVVVCWVLYWYDSNCKAGDKDTSPLCPIVKPVLEKVSSVMVTMMTEGVLKDILE